MVEGLPVVGYHLALIPVAAPPGLNLSRQASTPPQAVVTALLIGGNVLLFEERRPHVQWLARWAGGVPPGGQDMYVQAGAGVVGNGVQLVLQAASPPGQCGCASAQGEGWAFSAVPGLDRTTVCIIPTLPWM